MFANFTHWVNRKLVRVKEKMGPFWWYALVFFCVQRLSDVINAFVGLYLVPRYVNQSELGAVLPLGQIGSVLSLPLAILCAPFAKFLNAYATRGEFGKLKQLLRDVFFVIVTFSILTFVLAHLFLPLVFSRMRIQNGMLSFLIVTLGVLGAIAPVFGSAPQALKKFKTLAWAGLLSAPLRLATMMIFMPIRALSGYFVGQIVPQFYSIVVSVFSVRRHLFGETQSTPYWREDGKKMVRYAIPVAVIIVLGTLQGSIENFVIRHRLPDIDSAGYYMISRFAEIGSYVGATISFVLFPFVAERHEQGQTSSRMLVEAMFVSLMCGLTLAAFFHFVGGRILSLTETWRAYITYVPQMVLLTVMFALRASIGCFVQYEMACARFRFLFYQGGLIAIECLLLYGLTGYAFFSPWFPESWINWMASLNAARLNFLILTMFWSSMLCFCFVLIHLLLRFRGEHRLIRDSN